MKNLVSIVIPTYNSEEYISKAIESVIEQEFQDWELLIIDDGSTDKTKEIVKVKYLRDPNIHFIKRPDYKTKGANSCRNIGIENAKGKYVAFLDSDDEWKRNHLKNCFLFAEKKRDFNASYSGGYIKRGPFLIKRNSRKLKEKESHFDFLLTSFAPTPSYFIRNDLANKLKFDESLQRHQDWDYFIRFGHLYKWVFNPSMEVVVHRDILFNYNKIDFSSCIKFFQKFENLLSVENKIEYLLSMYEKAIFVNDISAEKYYRAKLIELGQIKFPRINRTKTKMKLYIQENYYFGLLKFMLKKFLKK